jgi:polyisoprenyl-teichoic acid--peptidoglycan teichoic acid transferase
MSLESAGMYRLLPILAAVALALGAAVPAVAAPPSPTASPDELISFGTPGWTYRLRLQTVLHGSGLARVPAAVGGAEVPVTAFTVNVPPNALNVLLLGTDRRPADGSWRTDAIILVSLDRDAKRVSMVSIPRDLWVNIPGHGMGRINTADFLGHQDKLPEGQLIRDTVAQNLGVTADRFVRVEMQAFIDTVDSLGGIDVVVDCPLHDSYPDELSPGGVAVIDLDTGIHHLDGQMALRYVRSRHGSTDFERGRREQRALRVLAGKLRQQSLKDRLPVLWAALGHQVTTDFGLREALGLVPLALTALDNGVHGAQIGSQATTDWVTPGGAQVLLLDPQKTADVLSDTLAGPATRPSPVALNDATGRDGWGDVAVAQLAEQGTSATLEKGNQVLPRSAVYYTAAARDAALAVASALRVSAAAVQPVTAQAAQSGTADVQVVLGANWRPCPAR